MREEAHQADRRRDKALLQDALAKEAAVEQWEADERAARREEIRVL